MVQLPTDDRDTLQVFDLRLAPRPPPAVPPPPTSPPSQPPPDDMEEDIFDGIDVDNTLTALEEDNL
ncbi:hypothetical protein OAO87_01030 [bacterium]|nr:hypothetical protein [bacterium]